MNETLRYGVLPGRMASSSLVFLLSSFIPTTNLVY